MHVEIISKYNIVYKKATPSFFVCVCVVWGGLLHAPDSQAIPNTEFEEHMS